MIPAIILFALTYVLMLVFSKYRPYIALASALIFIVTGMLPLAEIWGAIDLNVLLMIAGTMGLVQLFIDSKMPALLADLVMERVPNVQMAAVSLSLFAGVISAFVDNVATVLMVAPVALEICRKLWYNFAITVKEPQHGYSRIRRNVSGDDPRPTEEKRRRPFHRRQRAYGLFQAQCQPRCGTSEKRGLYCCG